MKLATLIFLCAAATAHAKFDSPVLHQQAPPICTVRLAPSPFRLALAQFFPFWP